MLGALAFPSENAHQSWGAVFLEDVLATGPGLRAIAPTAFAAVVATTRFAVSTLNPAHARTVLVLGSVVAAAGAAVVARAPSVPVALTGLVLLGPVYVGLWASATGLRGAMLAVAALGLALSALTLPQLALSRYPVTPGPAAHHAAQARVPSAHSS
ncbi:hypothetical protein ABZ754_25765 [Micromonospora purpureochromogenes]|uniref:hypothetical protein n=1 Tax=Micromonospora purpureochromogenes TaxID=47872 RepID=UPI0034079D05